MTTSIKITGKEPSFLPLYHAYLDFLHLYDSALLGDMVDINFSDADSSTVPCLNGFDYESIISCQSDVIIVDFEVESLDQYQRLVRFPKDKKYLIVTNGWWDTNEYDFGYEYRLFPCTHLLFSFFHHCLAGNSINSFVHKKYLYEDHKSNVFCSLAGIRKKPRDIMIPWIKKSVSYSNYVLNYNGQELGVPSRSQDINYDFSRYDSYASLTLPKNTWYDLGWSMPMSIFNSARFNFVVESSQTYHDFHLTEKTLKPLYIGQPFVVFAQRHFLKTLRELGFRTFGDLWSEEYDDIDDLNQRAQVIADLLDDLGRFDWNRHRQQLQEITDHNRLTSVNLGSTLLPKQMQAISDTLKSCGWF